MNHIEKYKQKLENRIIKVGLIIIKYEYEFLINSKKGIDDKLSHFEAVKVYTEVIDEYRSKLRLLHLEKYGL